jgi:hypothetical protein
MRTQQIGSWACLLVVSLGLLAGCESTGGLPSNAQTLTLLRQSAGDDSGVNDPGVWLLNSAKDVEGTGSKSLPSIKVDFNTESLLVLTLGQRPTTGYWARINAVQRAGDNVWVQGTANKPAKGDQVNQVVTTPYVAVVVAKIPSGGKVRSEIDSVTGKPVPPLAPPVVAPGSAPAVKAAAPAPAPGSAPAAAPAPVKK